MIKIKDRLSGGRWHRVIFPVDGDWGNFSKTVSETFFFSDCETFFPRLWNVFSECETFFPTVKRFFPTRENGFEAATLQGVLCVLHFVMTRTDTPFWMHGFQSISNGYLCSHTFRFPMVTGYDLMQKGIIWTYSQVTSFEVPAVGREDCVPLRKHWLSERYSLGLCGA